MKSEVSLRRAGERRHLNDSGGDSPSSLSSAATAAWTTSPIEGIESRVVRAFLFPNQKSSVKSECLVSVVTYPDHLYNCSKVVVSFFLFLQQKSRGQIGQFVGPESHILGFGPMLTNPPPFSIILPMQPTLAAWIASKKSTQMAVLFVKGNASERRILSRAL